jgi:hypothetical protein
MSDPIHITTARPVVIAGYVAPGPVLGYRGAVPPSPIDMRWTGVYRITGTTKNNGTPATPVSRRVRLHDQRTGDPVQEAWSDAATGAYAFDSVINGVYYIIALDHESGYCPMIAANVTPT